MEDRLGLGCITTRDCIAALPSGFFNFSMTPRAGIYFDLADVYPWIMGQPILPIQTTWSDWISSIDTDAD